jgi:hypothetical protein
MPVEFSWYGTYFARPFLALASEAVNSGRWGCTNLRPTSAPYHGAATSSKGVEDGTGSVFSSSPPPPPPTPLLIEAKG